MNPEQQKLQEEFNSKKAELGALAKLSLNQKLTDEEQKKQLELETFIAENTSKLQIQNTQIEVNNTIESSIDSRWTYKQLIKGSNMEAQLKALNKTDAQIEEISLRIDSVVRKYYAKELEGFPSSIIDGMVAGTQPAMIEALTSSGAASAELFTATAEGLSENGLGDLFNKISGAIGNIKNTISGALGPLTGEGPLPTLAKRVQNLTAFVVLHKVDLIDGAVPQLVNPYKFKELLSKPVWDTSNDFNKPETLSLFTLHTNTGSQLDENETTELKKIVNNPALKMDEKTLSSMEKALETTDKFLDKRSFFQDAFMGIFDKIKGPLSLFMGKGKNILPSTLLGTGLLGTAFGVAGLDAVYLSKNVIAATIDQTKEQTYTGSEKISTKTDYLQFIKNTILSHESGSDLYMAVNAYDVDGVSLGSMQWHKERASGLLKRMQTQHPDLFATIMGSEFVNLDNSSLRSTKWNEDKISRFKKLMSENKFKKIMDDQTNQDIQHYIEVADSRGITDPKAIAYYASVQNKRGEKGSEDYLADKTADGIYNATHEMFSKEYKQIQNTDFSAIVPNKEYLAVA